MNIKRMREKSGLTQSDFAQKLNVTQTAISKWETGIAEPVAAKLPQIAKILNCTVDELYGKE